MEFNVLLGDELGDSDVDEIIANKRFPQQRFSPINPVRARSETPKRGRYFSPIPVSRPWTPDYKVHRSSFLPQSSTDSLTKYRGPSTLHQTKTKSPSFLQSGPKSAFTSIESKRTVASREDDRLTPSEAEKEHAPSPSGESNNTLKSMPKTNSNEDLLSSPFSSSSRPTTPGKASFQPNSPHVISHNPPGVVSATSAYLNRTIGEKSNLNKSPIAEVPYGRSLPQFVYSTSQALPYQMPPGSFVSPFLAFPYAGMHIQDKVLSPLGPHTTSTHQALGSPTAVFRPNLVGHGGHPLVNTILPSLVNPPVHSPAPQATGTQKHGEKLPASAVTGSKYPGLDTADKSDEMSKLLSNTTTPGTRKDSKACGTKAPKNILKKHVADGMEQ